MGVSTAILTRGEQRESNRWYVLRGSLAVLVIVGWFNKDMQPYLSLTISDPRLSMNLLSRSEEPRSSCQCEEAMPGILRLAYD